MRAQYNASIDLRFAGNSHWSRKILKRLRFWLCSSCQSCEIRPRWTYTTFITICIPISLDWQQLCSIYLLKSYLLLSNSFSHKINLPTLNWIGSKKWTIQQYFTTTKQIKKKWSLHLKLSCAFSQPCTSVEYTANNKMTNNAIFVNVILPMNVEALLPLAL